MEPAAPKPKAKAKAKAKAKPLSAVFHTDLSRETLSATYGAEQGAALYTEYPADPSPEYVAVRSALDEFCRDTKQLADDLHAEEAVGNVPSLMSRNAARNGKRKRLREKAIAAGDCLDLLAILDHDMDELSPEFDAKIVKATEKALKAKASVPANESVKKASTEEAASAPHRLQTCILRDVPTSDLDKAPEAFVPLEMHGTVSTLIPPMPLPISKLDKAKGVTLTKLIDGANELNKVLLYDAAHPAEEATKTKVVLEKTGGDLTSLVDNINKDGVIVRFAADTRLAEPLRNACQKRTDAVVKRLNKMANLALKHPNTAFATVINKSTHACYVDAAEGKKCPMPIDVLAYTCQHMCEELDAQAKKIKELEQKLADRPQWSKQGTGSGNGKHRGVAHRGKRRRPTTQGEGSSAAGPPAKKGKGDGHGSAQQGTA